MGVVGGRRALSEILSWCHSHGMRTLRWVPLALSAALPLSIAAACGSDFGDCSSTNSCNPGAGGESSGGASSDHGGSSNVDGGTSGEGAAGVGATGATSTTGGAGGGGPDVCEDDGTSPSEKSCLIDEEFAIFVAPTGDDEEGNGSRENPFATIGHGMDAAIELGLAHVIACNGEYPESLGVDDERDGLSLHGGFVCPGEDNAWTYEEGTRAKVAPENPEYALLVSGLALGLTIEDVEFEAKDAEDDGESSIAAFVTESENVLLRRVKLVAGKGMDGAAGVTDDVVFNDGALVGNSADDGDGAPPKPCTCESGGSSEGGGGGYATPTGGGPGEPDYDGPGGEPGTPGVACVGQPGALGPNGNQGDGAGSLGNLDADGWHATSGEAAEAGKPGQGGGGGAGDDSPAGGGGSGGCGGCGGSAGSGGGGGGASIALMVFESTLALESCDLASDDAGTGGSGSVGQAGQEEGGTKGNGFAGGCQGGNGGPGGAGGPGGGGAGGISVGILFNGDEPEVSNDTTIQTGDPGDGGSGAGDETTNGVEGLNEDIWEI
jgi:hypothetical protein